MPEKKIELPVVGMTCANCSAAVERSLRKEKGVKSASVNLSTEKATVDLELDLALPILVDRVRRAGYDVAMGEASFLVENLSPAGYAAGADFDRLLLSGLCWGLPTMLKRL